MTDDDQYDDDYELRPSKSQRKRDAHALQALGEQLVALRPDRLNALPLPDDLREAVLLAQGIKARGGHKRQLQYIGKLMRNIDPEPIQEALARLDGQHAADQRRHHQLEQLRDTLIAARPADIDAFMQRNSQADRATLDKLLHDVRYQSTGSGPPTARRMLFRYLRDIDAQ